MSIRTGRITGTGIFLVGLILALALAMAPIWADYEAMSYFSTGAGYAAFEGLECPILMGSRDTGTITATLRNGTDKETQPYYEVEISGVAATRTLEGQVTIPAHAAKQIQWTVDARDIDLGSFIMNKFDILPFAGNPTRESTCGITVVNLGGMSGNAILGWGLLLSLSGILAGLAMRESREELSSSKTTSIRNGMRATGIAACLAMFTGFMGWWVIGLILVAITLLLVVILLRLAAV